MPSGTLPAPPLPAPSSGGAAVILARSKIESECGDVRITVPAVLRAAGASFFNFTAFSVVFIRLGASCNEVAYVLSALSCAEDLPSTEQRQPPQGSVNFRNTAMNLKRCGRRWFRYAVIIMGRVIRNTVKNFNQKSNSSRVRKAQSFSEQGHESEYEGT